MCSTSSASSRRWRPARRIASPMRKDRPGAPRHRRFSSCDASGHLCAGAALEGRRVVGFPVAYEDRRVGQFISQAEFGQPGSYRLRVLDPDSGVTSGPFCGSDQGLTASGCQPPGPRYRLQPGEDDDVVQVCVWADGENCGGSTHVKTASTTLRDFPRNREWGPHDGVYAARVYRHDRRRLLQRLRQSSRCTSVRSSRSSGFSTVSRTRCRVWPNGRPSAAGIPPATAKWGFHDGVYAARVYRHDRRRLLQRLRQSSRCTSVRSSRNSGFSTASRTCCRDWPNGRPSGGLGGSPSWGRGGCCLVLTRLRRRLLPSSARHSHLRLRPDYNRQHGPDQGRHTERDPWRTGVERRSVTSIRP